MTTGLVKHLELDLVGGNFRFFLFINTEKKITTWIGRCKQEELNIIQLDYALVNR